MMTDEELEEYGLIKGFIGPVILRVSALLRPSLRVLSGGSAAPNTRPPPDHVELGRGL